MSDGSSSSTRALACSTTSRSANKVSCSMYADCLESSSVPLRALHLLYSKLLASLSYRHHFMRYCMTSV